MVRMMVEKGERREGGEVRRGEERRGGVDVGVIFSMFLFSHLIDNRGEGENVNAWRLIKRV